LSSCRKELGTQKLKINGLILGILSLLAPGNPTLFFRDHMMLPLSSPGFDLQVRACTIERQLLSISSWNLQYR
jgi:hypothetical protein